MDYASLYNCLTFFWMIVRTGMDLVWIHRSWGRGDLEAARWFTSKRQDVPNSLPSALYDTRFEWKGKNCPLFSCPFCLSHYSGTINLITTQLSWTSASYSRTMRRIDRSIDPMKGYYLYQRVWIWYGFTGHPEPVQLLRFRRLPSKMAAAARKSWWDGLTSETLTGDPLKEVFWFWKAYASY